MNKEILISIYPKYNELIKSRIKNFEFRPFKILDSTGQIVMWIYETRPTKAIKYKMIVKEPIQKLKPKQSYGLGNDKFQEIINNGKFAYEIISFEELVTPISLDYMRKLNIAAPQGYAYINRYPQLKQVLDTSDKLIHF